VQSALTKVTGVLNAEVDHSLGKAVVTCEKGKVTKEQLAEAVTKAGFRAN
jgi:copper chaperone CopZ